MIIGQQVSGERMHCDPYDDDYRAPWNDPERPELGYLEEADYHEEHNEQ